jgi:hypothetical protein
VGAAVVGAEVVTETTGAGTDELSAFAMAIPPKRTPMPSTADAAPKATDFVSMGQA